MWCLVTWLDGGLANIRFKVGLNALRVFSNLNVSVILYVHADFKVRHRNKNNHGSLLYDNQTLLICILLRSGTLKLHTQCTRISTALQYFHILLSWKEMCLNSLRHSKCFVPRNVAAWTIMLSGIKVMKSHTCIQNIKDYSFLRLRNLLEHNPIENLTFRQMIVQT